MAAKCDPKIIDFQGENYVFSGAYVAFRLPDAASSVPGIEYLLLQAKRGDICWYDFPKGIVENGSPGLSATRKDELFQETGINKLIEVPGYLTTYTHTYIHSGKPFRKVVTASLGLVPAENSLEIHISDEHASFFWGSFRQCMSRLEYLGPRRLLRTAHWYVKENYASICALLNESL